MGVLQRDAVCQRQGQNISIMIPKQLEIHTEVPRYNTTGPTDRIRE